MTNTPARYTVALPIRVFVRADNRDAAVQRAHDLVAQNLVDFAEGVTEINTRAASVSRYWGSPDTTNRRLWIFADPATVDQHHPIDPETFWIILGLWLEAADQKALDLDVFRPSDSVIYTGLDLTRTYREKGLAGAIEYLSDHITYEIRKMPTDGTPRYTDYSLARIRVCFDLRNFLYGLAVGVLRGIGEQELQRLPRAMRVQNKLQHEFTLDYLNAAPEQTDAEPDREPPEEIAS